MVSPASRPHATIDLCVYSMLKELAVVHLILEERGQEASVPLLLSCAGMIYIVCDGSDIDVSKIMIIFTKAQATNMSHSPKVVSDTMQ